MKPTEDKVVLPFGLKAHEYADLLPLASGKSREVLLASLATGFDKNHPIVLINGLVLDGRNRLILGAESGLKKEDFSFREFNPSTDGESALEFVSRENLSRRHLSEGHLSLIAVNIAKLITEKLKAKAKVTSEESTPPTGAEVTKPVKAAAKVPSHVAREEAAKEVGVSTDAVKKAQLIAKYPDISKQVEEQKISLDAAYQEAVRRRDDEKAKKDSTKIKEERKTILATITKELGADHQLVKAAARGSILKEHRELKVFGELPKAQKLDIAPLIIQNISIKDAIKITSKAPDLTSTVDDLINWCIVQLAKGSKKTAELRLPAGLITFTPGKA
jgi:hypothetical protein